MSTPPAPIDVLYVDRLVMPLSLATTDDPAALLRTQVPDWFTVDPLETCAVAITVVSMLDEPVEAIGAYLPEGELAGRPRVTVDGEEVAPPWVSRQKSGRTAYGWVDPTWADGLVSVGTWIVYDHYPAGSGAFAGTASLALHLRCTTSGIDILIGGKSSPRLLPGAPLHMAPWNPYQLQLHEPGDLATWPSDTDYADFFNQYVEYKGTSDDLEGSSADGTVSYLARSPMGRTDQLWHVLLILGPSPIKQLWTGNTIAAAAAELRARMVGDLAERSVLALADPDPNTAEFRVAQDTPAELLADVQAEFAKRVTARKKPGT